MDSSLVQRGRYILRARFRRLDTCSVQMLPEACAHLLDWLRGHPALGPVVNQLRRLDPSVEEVLARTHDEWAARRGYSPAKIMVRNREHHAAVALAMVDRLARRDPTTSADLEHLITDFVTHLHGEDLRDRDNLGILRTDAIDVLFEYLDEHLDDRIAVHGLIEKFRQRSEHYLAPQLRGTAAAGGEVGLAKDLQLYLLDQSVDFVVEPVTRSGRADLVLRDSNRRFVVIDAKYLQPDAPRSTVRKTLRDGFHQVARYCHDLGEPFGHLVLFNGADVELRLDLDEGEGVRFLTVGGKQVLFVEVKIADLPSASRAGKVREIVLSKDDLRSEVDDAPPSPSAVDAKSPADSGDGPVE